MPIIDKLGLLCEYVSTKDIHYQPFACLSGRCYKKDLFSDVLPCYFYVMFFHLFYWTRKKKSLFFNLKWSICRKPYIGLLAIMIYIFRSRSLNFSSRLVIIIAIDLLKQLLECANHFIANYASEFANFDNFRIWHVYIFQNVYLFMLHIMVHPTYNCF